MDDSSPYVLIACPGLDHACRGFETFARECFEALRNRGDLRIELVKASGARTGAEHVVRSPTRDGSLVRALGRATSREPFVVEHIAFAAALVPLLLRRRPDVVYFSEWHLGRALAVWRQASRQRFALVMSNGALAGSGYGRLDYVQQLVPGAIEYTLERGESPDRQVFLPLGVAMARSLVVADRRRLRERLRLPTDRQIVLSAGAINRQKRMDYLIEEIALLPQPRPYLLLLGQEEADSAAIRTLAQDRLGAEGHAVRTVSPDAMADHYLASDAFVLASLWESFGRVLVEAQSHGLPCLAHEYPVMSWVLGGEGDTADLQARGAVAGWLRSLTAEDVSVERRARRHRSAYERFSWDVLADRYADMLLRAAPK